MQFKSTIQLVGFKGRLIKGTIGQREPLLYNINTGLYCFQSEYQWFKYEYLQKLINAKRVTLFNDMYFDWFYAGNITQTIFYIHENIIKFEKFKFEIDLDDYIYDTTLKAYFIRVNNSSVLAVIENLVKTYLHKILTLDTSTMSLVNCSYIVLEIIDKLKIFLTFNISRILKQDAYSWYICVLDLLGVPIERIITNLRVNMNVLWDCSEVLAIGLNRSDVLKLQERS